MSRVDIIELIGQAEIQAAFQRDIDKKWKQLERKHSNKKEKLLFVLLLVINSISKEISKNDIFEVANYLRLPILLLMLDEFLVRKWDTIEIPKPDDEQRYTELILKEFQIIGRLKNRMIESEATQEKCIVLEKGMILVDVPLQSESAFRDWSTQYISQLDEDWFEYYYEKSTKAVALTSSFRKEFSKKYGITPQQLYAFETALSRLVKRQLQGEGLPFIHFTPNELLSVMNKVMSQIDSIDKEKTKEFLKELEYTPDKHWARSPFLKVKYGRTMLYAHLIPAIYSLKVLSGAWLEHVLIDTRTLGMRSKDYGRQFEEYVRDLLRDFDNLEVSKGSLRIRGKKYPELVDCTGRSNIEIDVVAQSNTHVYFISCKAMDQSVGSKLLLTFHLGDYKAFFGNIIWDLEKSAEISDWAKCIRHIPEFLEERGFTGKEIVPLLVTSDLRPLSLDSVQQWCRKMKLVESIPEAKVIQAKALNEFI
ncbi:MAG: hypothetical protein RTU92_02255 [Candidatus Thorarchaeota archaeon]